jgi:hypothetical protein
MKAEEKTIKLDPEDRALFEALVEKLKDKPLIP